MGCVRTKWILQDARREKQTIGVAWNDDDKTVTVLHQGKEIETFKEYVKLSERELIQF